MMTAGNENEYLDDETLVAYADGALAPEEKERVERILETNEDARTLVELLRRSAELSAEAYREAMEAPPPERLVATILGQRAKGPNSSPDSGKIVSLATARALRRPPLRLALPIAASIAILIAGVVALRLVSTGPEGIEIAAGPVPVGSALAQFLESTPSGEPGRIAVANGAPEVDVSVMATFLDRNQRACREVEATAPADAGSAMTIAVACRSPQGQWTVEGTVRQVAGTTSDEGFSPAGGADLPELKALLGELGAGPALTTTDEGGLIARGWK